MKLFSLILSIVVFFISLYFFIISVPYVDTFDEIIYISLLGILMIICVTGVIINWEFFRQRKANRIVIFVSNSFSKKGKK
ncbi:MAG: hypothetical protein V4581_10935 [Bacteroidota bacterium]